MSLRKFSFLALLLLAAVRPAQAQTPQPPPDERFGIVETYINPAAASRAGAAWTRVRFQWADVQAAGPASWEPAVSEEQINREVADGRLIVGLLIGIPEWARGADNLPSGLYLPPNDPDNLWANFVREAVTRYDGRIDHWIIWNEPDIWQKDAPGHTWDGTVEDFAQLLRVAYVVAKEANPDAVIHLSAFTYFWDAEYGREQYFGRLLDVLLADHEAAVHSYYFDVATAHLYFQPGVIYDLLQEFQTMMTERGIQKPIWLVETNAPPHDDPAYPVPNYTFLVNQYEQAAFVPQVFAAALAAGAERVAIYKLQDERADREANPEPFGLLRKDTSRRPAFDTFQVAAALLAGAKRVVRERWDDVGQFRFEQAGQTTTVLFNRLAAARTAEVDAYSQTAELVSMFGVRATITPAGGVYAIDLVGAPCLQPAGDYCMIGGETVFLVQAGAFPTATPAPTLTPSPTALPTPTHTAVPLPTATATPGTTPAASAPTKAPEPLKATAAPTVASATPWFFGLGGLVLAGLAGWFIFGRKK